MAYVAGPFAAVANVQDLAQYMAEEFQKIEDEFSSAQGAATLFLTGSDVGVANIVPRIITEWNDSRPNRDFRAVVPDLAGSQIVAARSGQYLASFTVTAFVDFLRDYQLRMFINGASTELLAVSDPSNQTDTVTMVAQGSARVPREKERDVIDLRISADQDGARFDMIGSFFTVAWVGD